MHSLRQFFQHMNDVDFKYVVLRNFENLPDEVEVGPHSDLDLLVYDLDHFLEIFDDCLERVYPEPRVQFKLHFKNGTYTQLDARYLGDNYYPYQFEENILRTREWNERGFWIPNPLHHRLALAYHVVHHKGCNTYKNYLGDVTVGQLFEALKNSEIGWVEPDDPSVGRFNPYFKGATSVVCGDGEYVDKTQQRFLRFNLADNEERFLKALDNKHFPKLISRNKDTLRIEHCGEPLCIDNLPDDWKDQLIEICTLLEENKIVHRDIRLDNLMVKDGVIKLMDFGWARFADEEDGNHPDLLGYPNKCPFGFNDTYSMNKIIKQLDAEVEEECEYLG